MLTIGSLPDVVVTSVIMGDTIVDVADPIVVAIVVAEDVISSDVH